MRRDISIDFIRGALLCALGFLSFQTLAGGIVLGGSRVVYPADAKQTTISVSNKTDAATYLIQSWVENAAGEKTGDFIVTPPLYTSAPGNENMLRIISTNTLPDRNKESLYYLNVRTIPSVSKQAGNSSRGTLVVATQMRIKLFFRPGGLSPLREKAAGALTFTRQGSRLAINNPTPYYLTLTDLKAGGAPLDPVMVPPQGSESVRLPAGSAGTLTWNAINDYGGLDKGQSHIR